VSDARLATLGSLSRLVVATEDDSGWPCPMKCYCESVRHDPRLGWTLIVVRGHRSYLSPATTAADRFDGCVRPKAGLPRIGVLAGGNRFLQESGQALGIR
jgi:hypothetical protein